MSRSGSGTPAKYSCPANSSSSISPGIELPSRTRSARRRAASHDLVARAVADGQVQLQPRRRRACGPRCDSMAARVRGPRRCRSPTACTSTPFSFSSRALLAHVQLQQRHQRRHLAVRAVPVLAAEGEQGEHLHPRVAGGLDGGAHRAMPARWPNSRGWPRSRAQRPLPSMMMATCRGTVPFSRICWRSCSARHSGKMSTRRPVCQSKWFTDSIKMSGGWHLASCPLGKFRCGSRDSFGLIQSQRS